MASKAKASTSAASAGPAASRKQKGGSSAAETGETFTLDGLGFSRRI